MITQRQPAGREIRHCLCSWQIMCNPIIMRQSLLASVRLDYHSIRM